jgi:hypothetical protein
MKVVILTGVIGGGKTHKQRELVEQGYIPINFADALKDIASHILKKNAHGEDFKDEVGREFLQRLGFAIRGVFKNFFVGAVQEKIKNLPPDAKIVIADARYENELSGIFNLQQDSVIIAKGGLLIEVALCNYKSDRYDATNTHDSEKLAQRIVKEFPTCDYAVLDNAYVKRLCSGWQ